jgi:hypothetical protein
VYNRIVMKKVEAVLLAAILLASALLSAALLTRGHLWWDDFASYLMQADSLIDGDTRTFVQRNAFTIEESSSLLGPVAYPWGYPFLLAPVLAILGLKVLALKLISTLFFVLTLAVFYALARLRLPAAWSLLLTAVLAFNPVLLQAHDLILSDIPFLFFSTQALWLIEKTYREGEPAPRLSAGAAIGGVMFAAFATRTNGVLLVGALAIAQWMRFQTWGEIRRNPRIVFPPYFVFGTLAALWSLLLPGGQGSYFTHFSMLTPALLLDNVAFYLLLPAQMFDGLPLDWLFSILLGLLFLAGLFSNPRKQAAGLAYIVLTLGLFMTWPERQGLRFIFPILPFLLLIAAEGWSHVSRVVADPANGGGHPTYARIAQWTGPGLTGTLIVLSLFVSAQTGWVNLQNNRGINGPFDPVSAQMFEFVREQTPAGSVVIFFKPRALRLLTDRDAFMTEVCEDFGKGDYVVFHEKQGGNGQVAEPEACPGESLSMVFNNQRFTVYQISHP